VNRRDFLRGAAKLAGGSVFLPLVMVAPKQEETPLRACDGVRVWNGGVCHNVVVLRSDSGALAVLHSPDVGIEFHLED